MRPLPFFLALSLLLLTGCEGKTAYGPCIGILDEKADDKTYKVSTVNVVVAAILSETIIIPAVVLLTSTFCPIGNK